MELSVVFLEINPQRPQKVHQQNIIFLDCIEVAAPVQIQKLIDFATLLWGRVLEIDFEYILLEELESLKSVRLAKFPQLLQVCFPQKLELLNGLLHVFRVENSFERLHVFGGLETALDE